MKYIKKTFVVLIISVTFISCNSGPSNSNVERDVKLIVSQLTDADKSAWALTFMGNPNVYQWDNITMTSMEIVERGKVIVKEGNEVQKMKIKISGTATPHNSHENLPFSVVREFEFTKDTYGD